jgi:hypothetical protein
MKFHLVQRLFLKVQLSIFQDGFESSIEHFPRWLIGRGCLKHWSPQSQDFALLLLPMGLCKTSNVKSETLQHKSFEAKNQGCS